jgi:hypothetical protein
VQIKKLDSSQKNIKQREIFDFFGSDICYFLLDENNKEK